MSLTEMTTPSIRVTQDSYKHAAVTRSTGVEFTPPITHDMVRSLFDPTIKKSFFEIVILSILTSNFILAYYLYTKIGLNFTRNFYLFQYIFWRFSYNVGIGIILHYQSHYESLNKFATKYHLFDKKSNSKLANLLQFELQSKLPTSKKNDIYSYPDELNIWLIFRQFVDLILMQDFNTYMIFVFFSLPINNLSKLIQWKSLGGMLLIIFNIWVKLDAHRVVKDFAWYWGDFFFLQKDSELIFDGVFNISPHPMYSIGYAGYYGLSLISGDYHVLLVSIIGHLSQFLFLKYVETPHIERTYGDDSAQTVMGNCSIDDLITRENYDYSRPLISIGVWLENFDKLRIGDIFTVSHVMGFIGWYLIYSPSDKILFQLTFAIKLLSWGLISCILWKQHVSKWFTKLYLSNGYTQVYSYQQWQFLYNFSQSISYCLLSIQTINKMALIYSKQSIKNDMNEILFGLLLIVLQIWCNQEIRSAISDFGWFYGDFFLSNYITHKKLTSQGIYKYLNDPETILGVSGVWGTVLMTQFNIENIILATLWTITNFILIKFIERPHLIKLYGDDNANRQSGLQRTLLTMKPIRRVSELVDNVEKMIIRNLLKNNNSSSDPQQQEENLFVSSTNNNKSNSDLVEFATAKNKDWNDVVEHALYKVNKTMKHNCELKLLSIKDSLILPHEITLHWKIPKELFHKKDWIGLYKVIDTQNNYKYTKVSSNEHWKYIGSNFTNQNDECIEGDIIFDHNLLYFEQGVFEFRYHSNGSHRVMSISSTFEIQWPQFNLSTLLNFKESLLNFVNEIECVESLQGHKYITFNSKFTVKSLRNLIRDNIGITLNEEYIKNVQGDLDTICNKSWEIKKILDDLA
ncbi:phosphatidylethanolamine N-methyltransferase [Monosporozyma servazzii]